MHRSVKRALGVGVLGGAAYAAWRAWNARLPDRPKGVEWSTAPFPFPPVPHESRDPAPAPAAPERAPAWVEPDADGTCPPTHPVKAKLASGIYHVPGGANYARTKPDRCYLDAPAAEADGLRPSKV
ncbi:MAG TPA: hypothetical protein VGP92_04190 [Acidimicrobiia bacterium]|nr:hypothetical protein [Acidimicrobiia bacterium]